MATSANAKIQIELGQEAVALAAMTDSGDHQHFTMTGAEIYSKKSGYAPSVTPNGLASGRNLVSTHASNDTLTIAGCTCYLAGVLTTVAADAAKTITRPAGAFSKINSVTITSAGVYAVVAGVDSAGAAFSTTRGAAGGPPFIPTTSIEIAQIKTTTQAAAVVAAAEIFQGSNTYTERYDFPVWDTNYIGDGIKASVAAAKNAHVKFNSVLDLRHTGSTAKGIYMSGYEPSLSDMAKTMDFKPVENSASASSVQVYGNKTIGSTSTSIGTGGFTALLNDGVNDALIAEKDEILTVKFFPDADLSAYILTQGTCALTRTYPVSAQNQATVVIAAEQISSEFAS